MNMNTCAVCGLMPGDGPYPCLCSATAALIKFRATHRDFEAYKDRIIEIVENDSSVTLEEAYFRARGARLTLVPPNKVRA